MKYLILTFVLLFTTSACEQSSSGAVSQLPFNIKAEAGEEQAKGFVYHDANQNRIKDANESGVAGVAVSNGTDIVHTNGEGEWELPIADDAVIFIIKPKDWMTRSMKTFYHNSIISTNRMVILPITNTKQLSLLIRPAEINFPLYPETASNDFKIVVFYDPQPYSMKDVDFFAEDIVTELIAA